MKQEKNCHQTYPPTRDLSLLDDNFRAKVERWLAANPHIAVHETWRSEERQKCLREQGRSWVSHSNHQDGLAVDVHFIEGEVFPPSGHQKWLDIIESAKRYGIDSGYSLWGTDATHFQDNPSVSRPGSTSEQDCESCHTMVKVSSHHQMIHSSLWDRMEDIKDELTAMQETLHDMNDELRSIDI